jgi:hypothetical protein
MTRAPALANVSAGVDLVSLRSWKDFKLSLRFPPEPGSDSGVHLRGRYMIQITDRNRSRGLRRRNRRDLREGPGRPRIRFEPRPGVP